MTTTSTLESQVASSRHGPLNYTVLMTTWTMKGMTFHLGRILMGALCTGLHAHGMAWGGRVLLVASLTYMESN